MVTMISHRALIDDINACETPHGTGAFWWLGQQGYVVKLGDAIIYIDAFLSPHPRRQVPPPLDPEEVVNASIIIGTHDHTDHIDRAAWPAMAAASPGATLVVPALLRERLARELDLPFQRFAGNDHCRTIDICGVRITGIASAHEFLDQDPATGQYPYVGCVLEGNGCTLYHAGDCCIYEGLQTTLQRHAFDVVFLPINGRDAARYSRGCIGNMTYQEAVDLAGALRPRLVVPGHFDMFAGNGENPQLFIAYLKAKFPKIAALIPVHGERVHAPEIL